ncbi:MAG: hypothetical protein M3Z24_17185 [Chloroflexota bacterium]|nr:hypothetical protein [Chloroflexota bacterium]
MVSLSPSGEIATFQDVDQFQPGRSQFECGFFAVAIVKAMNEVGKPPTQSGGETIAEAEIWYAQYNGNNSTSNEAGMSIQQLYDLIVQVGLHFQSSPTDIEMIRAWIRLGYPVIIAGAETGMVDIGLGGVVPYPWRPSGSHIIVLTGVTVNGNFLVRDPANCTNLYDSKSLRPGPRTYDASRLQLLSATVIVPSWLPRPSADFDPRKETSMPTLPGIPTGWHDDGTTLTAPNGHKVILGFRKFILSQSNWNAGNMPLEEEIGLNPVEESNPSLGTGTQQIFTSTILEWTPARGVFEAWVGQEFLKIRAERDALKAKIASVVALLKG